MADTFTAALMGQIATSATGWGAVIGGVLDIRTVNDGRNSAAWMALRVQGFELATTCTDPYCDCMVRLLAQLKPDTQLVPVTVQVANA